MGPFACGINPKNEAGKGFHSSWTWWGRIVAVTLAACPELTEKIEQIQMPKRIEPLQDEDGNDEVFGILDGEKLEDQKICDEMAIKITDFLENEMWIRKELNIGDIKEEKMSSDQRIKLKQMTDFFNSWVSFLQNCGGYTSF